MDCSKYISTGLLLVSSAVILRLVAKNNGLELENSNLRDSLDAARDQASRAWYYLGKSKSK